MASLMSNPASQRSGVALTNWKRFARPVELVILALVMLLLVVSRAGSDWARVGAGMSGLRACVRLEPPRPRCALSCALSASASRPAPHRLCANQQGVSLLASALELRARRGGDGAGDGALRARRCRLVGLGPERRRAPRRRAARCCHSDAGDAQARQARLTRGMSDYPRRDVRARHAARAALAVGSAAPLRLSDSPGLRCQSAPPLPPPPSPRAALPAATLAAAAALPAAALFRSLPLLPSCPRCRTGALRRARHGAPRPLVRLRPPLAAVRCGGRGAARRLPARSRPGRGEAWLRLRRRLRLRLTVG